jgi:glycosyl hydrolase family 65
MSLSAYSVKGFMPAGLLLALAFLSLHSTSELRAESTPPDDFPRFLVPSHEREMNALRRLFWLHYQPSGPLIPLWDEWMPMSTLWPALGNGRGLEAMRIRWAAALSKRGMSAEGYIHTHQHDGLAHAQGWPFPLWTQAGGIGWHFRGTGVPGYDASLTTAEGWKLTRAQGRPIGDKGWEIVLTEPGALIETPHFSADAKIAPWLRLNWWAAGLETASPYLEWTTEDAPEFSAERRAYFAPAAGSDVKPEALNTTGSETRTMIPVYKLEGWRGKITGLRFGFDNRGLARLTIKSLHTACDTRHNINNSNFVRGSHDYFLWSSDVTFLRAQVGRIRQAMRFMFREFSTRARKCVFTTWPGHEGRSGIRYADGNKTVIPGNGIGSNYWDLLPFGGEDALATIYFRDALLDLAEIEEAIAAHPEWCVSGADAFDPADLRQHARELKEYGTKRFWNETTSRFGTVDLDGNMHDYGFTFLNNEAVAHGFATSDQAASIHAWISGQRIIETDSSRADDIYHWRFGPRSTTKRNIDYYFWAWSSPESIPFGYQVQDGGAVLGFSYYDLMARLITAGPEDAARRLFEICTWFEETEAAGGYRAYYSESARGTLQGGNVPGGLGVDKEFFESILVPQVMLYGFLGFQPTASGCEIAPRLPTGWPSLTITRLHLHDHVLDVTVRAKEINVVDRGPGTGLLEIQAPPGWTVTSRQE